jgi:putative NIF3 family GTP cyclohydrolase 1 type 2
MDLKILRSRLNDYLQADAFADYCPNGVQVENNGSVQHVATAITASLEAIEKAVALGVDALIVHHGFFWKSESPVLTGVKYRRIKMLMEHNIALLAYHLPLDVHPECGNGIQALGRWVHQQFHLPVEFIDSENCV